MTPDASDPRRGRLMLGARSWACALGAGGVVAEADKREGDQTTPAGTFALRRLLYRADRLAAPATGLAVAAIGEHDGWCDAPGDAAYNRPVRLPYPASAEMLWRADGVYDAIVVLGHNDAPVVDGLGSAVFLHIARPDFTPTEGCVALARADLLALLADLTPAMSLRIDLP